MPKRILIIGGVAGGASAATRARRLDETAEIVLVERGPFVSFANCGLPYHISGEIEDREDLLVQTPESLLARFNLDVRVRTEALSIDRAAKTARLKDLATGREYDEPYEALVLSPGAEPLRPPLPGLDLDGVHTLRNIPDMDRIKAKVDALGKGRALVVGGGYIGLEMAEALRHRHWRVCLAELAPQVMGPADPEMAAWLHQALRAGGVDLRLNAALASVERSASGALRAAFKDGAWLEADIVVLAIGVKPETKLAKEAGLELGPRGGIKVDAQMRTSDPSIWACGDAVEVRDFVSGREALVPLAGPANRQGRLAADSIYGRAGAYTGTQGTAIARVFGTVFAMTGLSEKACRAAGIACEKVYLHPGSHAGYYPGAGAIRFKLLFSPADGRVLGAQASGPDGVDKRIDVVATALRLGLDVRRLTELELCYAPPFGSAKDPVNMAGFVASNVLDGLVRNFHSDLADRPGADQVLLDVRTAGEHRRGHLPGSLHVPVDSLRNCLCDLPKDKELLVYCAAGLRGYIACRILEQSGFRCRNLSGGYLTWQAAHDALPA